MEIKEAVNLLNNIKAGVKKYDEAIAMAVDALEEKERYSWRDLRRNQDDLPEILKNVLVVSACYNEPIVAYRTNNGWESYGNDGGVFNVAQFETISRMEGADVIAWRYIEPFEEEQHDE